MDLKQIAIQYVAGNVGGILQVLVGHPLDTVKVRLQGDSVNKYRGMIDCLRQTVGKEGLFALYKGASAPLVMAGVLNGVMFSTNGAMKRTVAKIAGVENISDLSLPQVTVAAWMTAPVYCAVLAPTDFVKSRLQSQSHGGQKLYSGPLDIIKKTIKSDGVLGLFKGYGVTVATRLIGSPCYFVSYEAAKRYLADDRPLTKTDILLSGSIAGTFFWASNFPVDAIKTRIQTSTTPMSVAATMRAMYSEGGMYTFYRGFAPCIVRAAPANCVVFFGVELTLKFFGQKQF